MLWHNDELMQPYLNQNSDITIMISMSKDGELLSNTLKHLGFKSIRGSSSKRGKEALWEMTECVKDGGDICYATDGPRGPRHKVKAGAIISASEARAPIIVTACVSTKSFIFKRSWDRGIFPLPFSKVAILYSEPIEIPENLTKADLDQQIKRVENIFLRLTENADHYFNLEFIGFKPVEKLFFKYQKLRKIIFYAPSLIYGAVIYMRNKLFDFSILKTIKVDSHVLSIGNITLGGTGKTPATCFFAKEIFKNKGEKHLIAVVTGNYSDESKMLAALGLNVVAHKKKYKGVLEAYEKFKPDTIIVDDGFQHRYFHRDEDVVLINGAEAFKTNKLFPSGTLREPISSLKRATKILITHADEIEFKNISIKAEPYDVFAIAQDIRKINKNCEIFESTVEASSTVSVFDKRVLLISAIASPVSFANQVRKLGAIVVKQLVFPDHYNYTDKDYNYIQSIKNEYDLVLTTQKDASKLDLSKLAFQVIKIILKVSKLEEL